MEDHANFPMTAEEVKSFTEAMKKPEFRDLLNEYMDEISDPKNKDEYEEYLKQLEENDELPGRDVIRPKAEFCIKSVITDKPIKVFINVCSTKEIKKPKSKVERGGSSWKVPYAMAKPRLDQDKTGDTCKTFDIAFHNKALRISK
jgi:dynein assembly factor 2